MRLLFHVTPIFYNFEVRILAVALLSQFFSLFLVVTTFSHIPLPLCFQVWRLFTAVTFFGKLSFPFLINVYFLYSYAVQLERGIFDGQRAAMVYCVGIIWTLLLIIAYVMSLPVRR
jgi:hypothetical protein